MKTIGKSLLIAGAVPAGLICTWVGARVVAAITALYCVGIAVVGKLVLIGLAAALGAAFAHAAHAQGNTGFIYAKDRYGQEQKVWQGFYQNLSNFGNDVILLGKAYDSGVRAVLDSPQTQTFIQYTFTADPNSSGKDLIRATLASRNYPYTPSVTQVFVGSFGGTLIGYTAGSMFANAFGNTVGGVSSGSYYGSTVPATAQPVSKY